MKNTIEEGQRQDCRMTGWWSPGSVPTFAALRLGGFFPPFPFVDGKGRQSREAAKPQSREGDDDDTFRSLCAPAPLRENHMSGFWQDGTWLTRRTDTLWKGCFTAMNWQSTALLRSSLHAPGEAT
jgi:hypothetical protein